MFAYVVEVVEVELLVIDDRFEEFHANTVAILAADEQVPIIRVDRIVFERCIEWENLCDRLPSLNDIVMPGDGVAI